MTQHHPDPTPSAPPVPAPAEPVLSPGLLVPPAPVVPGVERIAVLRANGLGDLVMTLPALEALRAAYPSAEITYLGAAWHPALLDGRPGPWDRTVVVPPYPGVREPRTGGPSPRTDADEVRTFFEQQKAERYDLALQLHGGGGNSNPFVQRLGARLTIGSCDIGAPPLDRWVRYVYYQHEVLRHLEVVALAGARPVGLEPRITVLPDDAAAAEDVLAAVAGGPWEPPPPPLVAIHPGATDPRRRWPPEYFAAVAEMLAGHGAQIVIVGEGADDELAAARIAADMVSPPLNLVGRLTLPAMVGLLSRCRLMIGNDSGPRHLAAATGTATVGVYWCGNVINAGPLTRGRHRVGVSMRTRCPECGREQDESRSGRCGHEPSFVSDVPVDLIATHALELFDDEAAREQIGQP